MAKKKLIKRKEINKSDSILSVLGIIFSLMFIAVGTLVLYLGVGKGESKPTITVSAIIGAFIIVGFIDLIIYLIKNQIHNRKAKYIIIVDKLRDYEKATSGSKRIYLFFEKIFEKYNRRDIIFDNFKENIELNQTYYLFISPDGYIHKEFNTRLYKLDPELEDSVIPFDELDKYIDFKKNSLEEDNTDKLTKRKIFDDIHKKTRRKAKYISLCISIAIFIASILIIKFAFNIKVLVVLFLLLIIFLADTILHIKKSLNLKKAVVNGNLTIKKDIVESDSKKVRFKDKNCYIYLKFKDYNKNYYAERKYCGDTKVGDTYYLVYLTGKKEPSMVYNTNKYTLDDDLKISE